MADLTLRTTKGSALTYQELDDNFSNLDSDVAVLNTDIIELETQVINDATALAIALG